MANGNNNGTPKANVGAVVQSLVNDGATKIVVTKNDDDTYKVVAQ